MEEIMHQLAALSLSHNDNQYIDLRNGKWLKIKTIHPRIYVIIIEDLKVEVFQNDEWCISDDMFIMKIGMTTQIEDDRPSSIVTKLNKRGFKAQIFKQHDIPFSRNGFQKVEKEFRKAVCYKHFRKEEMMELIATKGNGNSWFEKCGPSEFGIGCLSLSTNDLSKDFPPKEYTKVRIYTSEGKVWKTFDHHVLCMGCTELIENEYTCEVPGCEEINLCDGCITNCSECNMILCEHHHVTCIDCGKFFCENHGQQCESENCNNNICGECKKECDGCNETICYEHYGCHELDCDAIFCEDCSTDAFCKHCEGYYCETHIYNGLCDYCTNKVL